MKTREDLYAEDVIKSFIPKDCKWEDFTHWVIELPKYTEDTLKTCL